MNVKRPRGRTFFGLGGVGDDVGVGGQVTLTRTVRTEPDTAALKKVSLRAMT